MPDPLTGEDRDGLTTEDLVQDVRDVLGCAAQPLTGREVGILVGADPTAALEQLREAGEVRRNREGYRLAPVPRRREGGAVTRRSVPGEHDDLVREVVWRAGPGGLTLTEIAEASELRRRVVENTVHRLRNQGHLTIYRGDARPRRYVKSEEEADGSR